MISLDVETPGRARLSQFVPHFQTKVDVHLSLATDLPEFYSTDEIENAVRCTMIELYHAVKRTGFETKLNRLKITHNKKGVTNDK